MNVILEGAQWRAVHGKLLARALKADPMETTETLRRDVEAGRATLLQARREGSPEVVCAIVMRIEQREGGKEGVIVATAGARGCGLRLLDLMPELERRLIAEGCVSIRVHPSRPGMRKFCEQHGYALREWVMGKRMAA